MNIPADNSCPANEVTTKLFSDYCFNNQPKGTDMNTNQSVGLRSVIDHLETNDLKHSVEWETGLVRTGFDMQNAKFNCIIEINHQDNLVQFTGLIPIQVPSEKRRDVCELLTLINWHLALGKFQMDLDDGELRFQGSAPYPQGKLADEVIRQVIGRCVIPVDFFFPAIAAVTFGGKSPKVAFEAVLNRPQSPDKDAEEAVPSKRRIELN